jgi:hypothetical protein
MRNLYRLASLIWASTSVADADFDLLIELMRRTDRGTNVIRLADKLIQKHGSAEKVLAELDHEY